MDTKSYYAMTFYNTTDTMQTERKPRSCSQSGLCQPRGLYRSAADLPSGLRERTNRHTQNLQKT